MFYEIIFLKFLLIFSYFNIKIYRFHSGEMTIYENFKFVKIPKKLSHRLISINI